MARAKKTLPNKPFDATTKILVETNPKEWLEFLGFQATEYELVSADLSTVTTDADRIIKVKKPKPFVLHQEFQASHERRFPDRCLRYNVLTEEKHKIPVHTAAILLRRSVDPKGKFTGYLERKDAEGNIYLTFKYQVIRLWEIPVEAIFAGGLALLPLALLSDISATTPETVVREMEARLEQSSVPQESQNLLMTSAFILAGLTYEAETIERLFQGVRQMKESSTYQLILKEGRAEGIAEGIAKGEAVGQVQGAQNFLLLIGEGRFGVPNAEITQRVRAINSIETLRAMGKRLLVAESWAELLATPQ